MAAIPMMLAIPLLTGTAQGGGGALLFIAKIIGIAFLVPLLSR
jgi:hypothetical protein